MAISIANLRRIKADNPPRVLIYGPPGLGKTSLASEWPDAVFLQTEDGAPADCELNSFGLLSSYDEVLDAIGALYSGEHTNRTVVLDSLDKLEPLVWQKVCSDNGWASVETPGYGKGFVFADSVWRDLIDAFNALRRDRGMSIIYLAHSQIVTVDDPMSQSYSRFDIRLHKRAAALFQDEVDAILFLNQDVVIKSEKVKSDTRSRADGGGNRWLYAAPRPSFVAKNRFGIPDKMRYERGRGFEVLAPYFPAPATLTKTETETAA